jgi:hypothetical protein
MKALGQRALRPPLEACLAGVDKELQWDKRQKP